MKTLRSLALSRLSVLEFGQHMKSIVESFSQAGEIKDAALINYVDSLRNKMAAYNKACLQIAKSDETSKIVIADKERDLAVSAATRMLHVHELSTVQAEQEAFASLANIFNTYKGVQNWNFEEETNGIDKLIENLKEPKYTSHISLLNMGVYITRIETANNSFKALFSNRTYETASKEVFDIKALRKEVKTIYEDMVNYIFTMAKVYNTDQFNNSLDNINSIRKYYSDMLARQTSKKTTAEKSSQN